MVAISGMKSARRACCTMFGEGFRDLQVYNNKRTNLLYVETQVCKVWTTL